LSTVASTKHSLLFTISADQRLRIWSLSKSQFIKEYDITPSQANSGRLLSQPPAHLLGLDDTHDHGEFLFYLLTFNPLEEGQFILWGGEQEHGKFMNLIQLQEPFKPIIPPDTGVWNISDFFLAQVKTLSDSHGAVVQNTYERALRLWIAWKSYTTTVIQYTDIHRTIKWITIMSDKPDPTDDEVESGVEYWADRIARPGRFSDASILTALNMYQDRMLGADQSRDLTLSSRTLRKDLITGIIGRRAKLRVNQHSGQLDFEKYRQDLSLEFSQFESTCKQLSLAGNEFKRLSFDSLTGEVLVVRADGIMAIRNLSGSEILKWGATGSDGQFNDVLKGDMIRGTLYGDFKDKNVRLQVVALARAAYKFRCAIAGGNLGDITAGLLEEVMSDSNFSVEDRLWAFYDKYLSDQMFTMTSLKEEVVAALALVTELSAAFRILLEILSTDICQDDTVVPLAKLTSVWGDVVGGGVAETVAARWILLRDFALFSAWLYSTEDQLVDPELKKGIEGYWSDGLRAFKGVNMLRHLATIEIAPSSSQSQEDQVSGSLEGMHLDDSIEVVRLPPRTTALRYLIEDTLDSSGVGLNNISFPASMALSLVIASILTQINCADGYSGMAIRIVSQLVRLGANVEASKFARYLPNTPVGGYIWGHVLLQQGSWEKSSSWFSRVGPVLAKSARTADFEYAKVIFKGKQIEGIGKGLFRYYAHVATLFEEKHAHSKAIYYCQRALAVAQEVWSR
jgi:Nucleoporin Nup120/160